MGLSKVSVGVLLAGASAWAGGPRPLDERMSRRHGSAGADDGSTEQRVPASVRLLLSSPLVPLLGVTLRVPGGRALA